MEPEIKQLSPEHLSDFKNMLRLFEDVFEMQNFELPPDDYLEKILSNKGFLVFVAKDQHQIVGGLTAYIWSQYYNTKPVIYIYDLAVHQQHQRKGIGKKLVEAVNNFGKIIGAEETFVQADEADDHALKFYRATGGSEEFVRHFTYQL